MTAGHLEHVNFTVSNPDRTAELLCTLFDWQVRWQGPSLGGGRTVHVGRDDAYVALYSPPETTVDHASSYIRRGGLNHVGVVVDDLEETEKRVVAAGLEPHNHQDYEPGRRFYFNDNDGIEFEVVSYR